MRGRLSSPGCRAPGVCGFASCCCPAILWLTCFCPCPGRVAMHQWNTNKLLPHHLAFVVLQVPVPDRHAHGAVHLYRIRGVSAPSRTLSISVGAPVSRVLSVMLLTCMTFTQACIVLCCTCFHAWLVCGAGRLSLQRRQRRRTRWCPGAWSGPSLAQPSLAGPSSCRCYPASRTRLHS